MARRSGLAAITATCCLFLPGVSAAERSAAANAVIVRLAPGVEPGLTPAGAWTLASDGADAPSGAVAAMAETLAQWGVTQIEPAASVPHKNCALAAALGLERYYLVQAPPGADLARLAAELAGHRPLVETAELASSAVIDAALETAALETMPNDVHFNMQWALHNTGQTVQGIVGIPDADVDGPEAWDLCLGTDSVTIAILDTGVSQSHPDLAGKLVAGWNTYNNNSNTDDSPDVSHGTHCAGIAAAVTNNSTGVAGLSWGARIMPMKVLGNDFGGTEVHCANGITWAADHGAQVISISLSYANGTSFFHDCVLYAAGSGCLIFASAGNSASTPIRYPAAFPEVVCIGASTNRDELWPPTSTGAAMDLAAPGENIISTWDTSSQPNTYVYHSGTSMACPYAAGLAALAWSANAALSNVELRALLESTAEDRGAPGWDVQFGHGRINAHAAVVAALALLQQTGDLNCDGAINALDINPFVLALVDPAGYAAAYPQCDSDLADCNGDGEINALDINPFVRLITGR